MYTKKIILAILIVLILTPIMFLTKRDPLPKNILGTYANIQSPFHSIYFDTNTNEYCEHIFENEKNIGTFTYINNKVEILNGKYVDYDVIYENDILTITNGEITLQFKKVSDAPIVVIE